MKLFSLGKKLNKLRGKSSSYGYYSTYITKDQPVWQLFTEFSHYIRAFECNPIVNAVISLRARFFANMKFTLVEVDTNEEIIKGHKRFKEFERLINLLASPNPLQSTWEWLKFSSINQDVFGNSYDYAAVPKGYEDRFTYEDVNAINNIPPYLLAPVLTGKWLEATEKTEIISKFVLTVDAKQRDINTNQIFHRNYPNLKMDNTFTQGESLLKTLARPISNIDAALESRNVIIRKRGAIGAWVSDAKDQIGSVPLSELEIKKAQKAFEKYGTLEHQYQQMINPIALKWQSTVPPIKDLMLLEEISSDAIYIANQFGVPEVLLKTYFSGATFENQEASVRRMYQDTTIPEAKDWLTGFNNFLKMGDSGVIIKGTYDHLPVLQSDKNESADVTSKDSARLMDMFLKGAIIYDNWLTGVGLPSDTEIGGKRIWDLTPEQIAIITNRTLYTNTNEQQKIKI